MLKCRPLPVGCPSCGSAADDHPTEHQKFKCSDKSCFFSTVWVPGRAWNRRALEDALAQELYEVAKNKNLDHPGVGPNMAMRAEKFLLRQQYTIVETSRATKTKDSE